MKFYEYCDLMKNSTIIVGSESRVIENNSNYNSSYLRITPLLNKLFFEYSNIGTYERLKNQNVFRIVIVN